MTQGAIFSECRRYRYVLERKWEKGKKIILFIMLNPSTANEKKDDPTIRKITAYAKSWGFNGLMVCNINPYRSVNPYKLATIRIPNEIKVENMLHLRKAIEESRLIICGWGNNAFHLDVNYFKENIDDLKDLQTYCFKINKNGTPTHPLYQRKGILFENLIKYKI